MAESELARLEELLDRAEKICRGRFEERENGYARQLDEAQKRLRREPGGLSESERQGRHCQIQHLRAQKEQVHLLRTHAIPVAYSNRQAKLKLLRQWPTDLAEIQHAIAGGTYHAREPGDVLDIGIREVGRGQEKDVEQGQEAVRQMKESDVMPPPVESELIQTYVQRLGERIAEHSDLRLPVQIEVLDSPEVNAFALPGGFLFVQRGLLEEAEDEAQLAGVLSHEITHASARHAHRLMSRASWSSLIYQTAQIAALILTGGISSIASSYAFQYGFMGLGLVLNLDLLQPAASANSAMRGSSRENRVASPSEIMATGGACCYAASHHGSCLPRSSHVAQATPAVFSRASQRCRTFTARG